MASSPGGRRAVRTPLQLRLRAVALLVVAVACASAGPTVGLHGILILWPVAVVCAILAVRLSERAKRRRRELRAR